LVGFVDAPLQWCTDRWLLNGFLQALMMMGVVVILRRGFKLFSNWRSMSIVDKDFVHTGHSLLIECHYNWIRSVWIHNTYVFQLA